MAVMSTAEAWGGGGGQPFTVDDLDRFPDDGRRYELIDGVLTVTPAPITVHQLVAFRLARDLDTACPEGMYVVPATGMMIDIHTELVPDIVVVGADQVGPPKVTKPPLLAVEVQSPSTKLYDLNQKKSV